MIELEIPLRPISWKAPLKGKYTFYDPCEKDKRSIRFYLKDQYKQDPINDYVIVKFQFLFSVPKSYSKKKKDLALSCQIFPTQKDCTNLQKLYEDCLKGIVITDDRNVIGISSKKFYAQKDSVFINIYTLEDYALKKR